VATSTETLPFEKRISAILEAPAAHEKDTIKQYFHLTNTDDERMNALRLLLGFFQ
jgi:hypothetical protein